MRHALGLPRIVYEWMAEKYPARRDRLLTYWTRTQARTAKRLRAATANPWSSSWYSAALCVHSKEGAWNDNTGNGYYGGMQFDYSSWLANGGGAYAPTANLASPHDQLLVAYHYWQASGWNPWPNTARACGLL